MKARVTVSVLTVGVVVAMAGCGFGGAGGGGSSGSSSATPPGGLSGSGGSQGSGGSGGQVSVSAVSFTKDVQPILQKNCTSCHAPGMQQSTSPLDTFSSVVNGSTHYGYTPGAYVVPGHPEQSLLMWKLKGQAGPMMPQTGSLTAQDVTTIWNWILGGAIQFPPNVPPPTGGGKAASLVVVSGSSQAGIAGQAVNPFIVQVLDSLQNPVAGVTVTFAIASGGGSLSATSVATDASGLASTTLTLGSSPGQVSVTASSGTLAPVTFTATGTSANQPRSYVADIAPILALHCTACHGPGGSESGDPLDSYTAVTQGTSSHSYTPAAFVNVAGKDPSTSLLFIKVTGPSSKQGALMPPNAPLSPSEVTIIQEWIQQGAVDTYSGPPAKLAIFSGNNQSGPDLSRLPKPLTALVTDAQSNPVAGVTVTFAVVGTNGTLSATTALTTGNGQAGVTLLFGPGVGQVQVTASATGLATVTFNESSTQSTYKGIPLAGSSNPFDQAALVGLQAANVEPQPLSGDGEFLRRVTADLAGRLPTTAELSAFLADSSPNKRATKIDALLASPEYDNHWAIDIVGAWACVNSNTTAYNAALVQDVHNDMPLSQLVTLYVTGDPTNMTTPSIEGQAFITQFNGNGGNDAVDQLMLSWTGMTSQCARCHDHHLTVAGQDDPMWVQDDNYGLYAFEATSNGAATKLDITGKRFGAPVQPHWVVDGYENQIPVGDPSLPTLASPLAARQAKLAQLLTASNAFARGTGHRIFAEVMAPLLDPNQFLAANIMAVQQPAVLQTIATEFANNGHSLKSFLRELLNSNLYQITTVGTTTAHDALLARRKVRRHHSEIIDQGVSQVCGLVFNGSSGFVATMFGYPLGRTTIMERSDAVNLGQGLVLLNSTQSTNGRMVQGSSSITALANQVNAKTLTLGQAVTQIYEAALGRDPSPAELTAVLSAVATAASPAEALQDVTVGLCSSVEFVCR